MADQTDLSVEDSGAVDYVLAADASWHSPSLDVFPTSQLSAGFDSASVVVDAGRPCRNAA